MIEGIDMRLPEMSEDYPGAIRHSAPANDSYKAQRLSLPLFRRCAALRMLNALCQARVDPCGKSHDCTSHSCSQRARKSDSLLLIGIDLLNLLFDQRE